MIVNDSIDPNLEKMIIDWETMSIAGDIEKESQVQLTTAYSVQQTGARWVQEKSAYIFPDGSRGVFEGNHRNRKPRFVELVEKDG